MQDIPCVKYISHAVCVPAGAAENAAEENAAAENAAGENAAAENAAEENAAAENAAEENEAAENVAEENVATENSAEESAAAENAASENVAAEKHMWDDDIYVGLPAYAFNTYYGDSCLDVFDLYDSAGHLAGTTLHSPDIGYNIGCMEKGGLYTYEYDNEYYVQSTTTLAILYHAPKQEYRIWAGREHYAVYEYETGTLELYDNEGKLQSQSNAEPFQGDPSDVSLSGVEADGAVLLFKRIFSSEAGYQVAYALKYCLDGSVMDSNDSAFPDAFRDGCSASIGEYFLKENQDGLYEVYTKDGVLIMTDVQCSSRTREYDPLKIDKTYNLPVIVDYLLVSGGETMQVLDRYLQDAGTVPAGMLSVDGGYAIGLAADALGGKICDQVVSYCGDEKVPCHVEGDHYELSIDGEMISLTLPKGESLFSLNETLVQTSLQDEGGQAGEYRLYRLADLKEGDAQEDRSVQPVREGLSRQMVLARGSVLENSGYGMSREESIIYNEQMEPIFSTKGVLQMVPGGMYFLRRGPWEGIIDREGNWIIRQSSQRE